MNTAAARLAGAMLGALTPLACAQDLAVKAPPQARAVILTDATIHPVSGPAIEHAWIAFENGEILAMGAGVMDVITRTEPIMLDAAGLDVWPGLIAPYTQLGLTEIAAVRATIDTGEVGVATPEVRAVAAVNPDSTLLPVTRSNGVLIAGVFPARELDIFSSQPRGLVPGRGGAIRLDGWTWEDMAIAPDVGLMVNVPPARPIRARWMDTDEDEQRRTIERAARTLDELFANAAAYRDAHAANNAAPPEADLRYDAMLGVLPDADGAIPSRRVFFRASEVDQIVNALRLAQRHALRPVIVGGRDAALCLDLLRETDAAVILESSFRMPKRDDSPTDELFTLPQRLQQAGIPWAMASGDDTAHERSLPFAAAWCVAYGMAPDDALRAMTLTPARILGIDARYGSLEQGKSATLIVTRGHPLDVLGSVELAFIDGRAIDLESKHSALARKYREKYRQLGILPPPER